MKLFSAVLFVLLSAACSHNQTAQQAKPEDVKSSPSSAPPPPPPMGASIEAKELAAEEQAPYVTEFKFRKGKQNLVAADVARLRKFLEEAKTHGEIAELKVISWSDMEYPSVHTKKLSQSQRKLAGGRGAEIKKLVHEYDPGLKIEEFNMAERPNALGEWMGTANSRIKKSLEVAGIPNTDTSVKTPAKSSRSMILVMLKKK